MQLMGLVVNLGTALANLVGLTAVTLLRRNELYAAVAVLVVVPVDERGDPLTGLLFGCEWLAGVIMPIFHCPEQGFGVGVVV